VLLPDIDILKNKYVGSQTNIDISEIDII